MHRLLMVAFLLLAGLPAGDAAFADAKVVPSETCRGLWIVSATFGTETLDLVLDTGAATTHVDPDALERIRSARVKSGKKYTLRNGLIGPLVVERIRVTAHDLDHLGRALGREIDGILGMSAFRTVLLTLDYENEQVLVDKGRLSRVDGRSIFRDVGPKRPMLQVAVAGGNERVLIDSGSSGQFDFVPDERLEWVTAPRPVNGAARYREIEIDEAGRMAGSLRFGPATFEEPIVERSDRTSLAGYDVLRHFVWTFDRASKRMRIRPLSDEPIRMEALRGMGAAFNPVADGFEVLEVFPTTPAADAGLEIGDLVTHLDGAPVYERGCTGVSDDSGRDSVNLTVQRGAEAFEVEVGVVDLVP